MWGGKILVMSKDLFNTKTPYNILPLSLGHAFREHNISLIKVHLLSRSPLMASKGIPYHQGLIGRCLAKFDGVVSKQ